MNNNQNMPSVIKSIKKLVYCATPSRISSRMVEIMDYVTGGVMVHFTRFKPLNMKDLRAVPLVATRL